MKTRFEADRIDYDGTQIHSLWAYRTFGLQGDSIVAFRGACDIPTDRIVDLEDVRANARIAGPDMLHFIVERFDTDLEKAVILQRLLVTIAKEELGGEVRREGDDLFVGPGKLSISIAARTPVSTKIHLGINIVRAPDVGVETRGLEDLGIDPRAFGESVLDRLASEMAGVLDARTRVRGAP